MRKFNIKFRYRKRGGLSMSLGPLMWTCTNGWQNYAREYSVHCRAERDEYADSNRFLIPSLEFQLWRRAVLASDENLGTVYHTIGLRSTWWVWRLEASLSRTLHTKTQAQVDTRLKAMGIR